MPVFDFKERESIILAMKEESGRGKKPTPWGRVAVWYDNFLETRADTYQVNLILPNLLRLLGDLKGKKILDLACGQGFFSRAIADLGAEVTGIDISKELIDLAKRRPDAKTGGKIKFLTASADRLPFREKTFEAVVSVLALQNIKNLSGAVSEVNRVLKNGGRFLIVINHPAFRIPKKSDWGFDEVKRTQFRLVEGYLSESTVKIDMHPGRQGSRVYTTSFHRPLQVYFKVLAKCGFAVTRLEEWVSHKKSTPGPRASAENRARREFPLFLFLEAVGSWAAKSVRLTKSDIIS